MVNRLIDFFTIVGGDCSNLQLVPDPSWTRDDDSESYSGVEITSISQLQFKPQLLSRYPLKDYKDASLSNEIPTFCLPEGVRISTRCEMPKFFTFTLTNADGSRVYGSTLWFFEYLTSKDSLVSIIDSLFARKESPEHGYTSSENTELDSIVEGPSSEELIRKELEQTLYISKAITITSHYPLFSVSKKFLMQLYRIHLTPTTTPIERWVCNFCSEVPLPPKGKACVEYHLGPDKITIKRPPPNQLPLLDVPVQHVFHSLDINNILLIFNCILAEQRILFHSQHYSLLGTVGEFFLSSIYPLEWWHVYIPLLPRSCVDFIEAPMPFIMGVHSSSLPACNIPKDVIVVDLDNNTVTGNFKLKSKLPEKQHRKLYDMLSKLKLREQLSKQSFEDIDQAFSMAPTPEEVERGGGSNSSFPTETIRMTFFRFFVSLFQKYRTYLKTDYKPTELDFEVDKVFRKVQFIQDQACADRPFIRMILETQAFYQFLYQRTVETSAASQYEIRFFDESIHQKINRSKLTIYKRDTPFLDDKKKEFAIQRTSVAPSPEMQSLDTSIIYHHETFPILNPDLFYTPRATEVLVSEEDMVSKKKSAMASWKQILKQLDILQQQLGKQQRSRNANSDFNDAIRATKDNLRTDHTRSISYGNLEFSEYEESLRESSNGPVTISLAGASVSWFGSTDTEEYHNVCSAFHAVSIIDTETCPHCEKKLTNRDIRMGWSNDVNEYRITCTCGNRFVPRFTVFFEKQPKDSHEESMEMQPPLDGKIEESPQDIESTNESGDALRKDGTKDAVDKPKSVMSFGRFVRRSSIASPRGRRRGDGEEMVTKVGFQYLYEFLSPALLRKEVENLIKKNIATSQLLENHRGIFWNLVLHFRDLDIPLEYLIPFLDWKDVAKEIRNIIDSYEGELIEVKVPIRYDRR